MRSHARLLLVVLALVALHVPATRADQRIIPPEITKIWPMGVQRGTTASFTLEGRNLSDIKAVIFDTPGLTTKVTQITDLLEGAIKIGETAPVPLGKKQSAAIEVTVSKDAAPGLHWFRIRTPLGTSNLMPFDVGRFAEVHSRQKAEEREESIALPATFVGTIAVPGQIDTYPFDGRAGEEVVFRVIASQLGSKLESQLSLHDASGRVLAQSGEYLDRPDAVLTYKLPQAGKYALSVTDREEGGGADHFYRVDAGPLPYITQVFPLEVRAGEPAMVKVSGANLGDAHDIKVDPPKLAHGWTTMPLKVKTGDVWSLNSVKLAIGNEPEILEQEPNNSPGQAQRVTLPATINGHIAGTIENGGADEDFFRFHAAKGERLTVDVAAARLGSPLDSVIEVLDAQGNPLPRATLRCLNETAVTLSDRDSRTPNVRLLSTSGLKAREYVMIGDELDQVTQIPDQPDADVPLRGVNGLRWAFLGTSPDAHPVNTPVYRVEILPPGAEFPSNGLPVFHLTWRNDDGGPGYGSDSRLDFVAPQDADYILHLKDVRGLEGPDYAYCLSVYDAKPDYQLTAEPSDVNVPRGGSTYITITANRIQGYDGPIEVSVEGLPSGIAATLATIPAGQDSTVIVLTADAKASIDSTPAAFRIVGHTNANGIVQTRIANEETPLQLASVIPAPDLVVTTTPTHVTLEPGRDFKVTLNVERRSGFQGRVPCTVENLPPGVRVVNSGLNGVLVHENQSSRTFTLHAEDWAQPITQPIYVVAEAESNSPTMHPSAPLLVDVVGNPQTASAGPNNDGDGRGTGSPPR